MYNADVPQFYPKGKAGTGCLRMFPTEMPQQTNPTADQHGGGFFDMACSDHIHQCKDCRRSGTHDERSICEYTECGTESGKFCEFPFRYKGRLYDTCITMDDKGSQPGDAWCSTSVDPVTRNHIPGMPLPNKRA